MVRLDNSIKFRKNISNILFIEVLRVRFPDNGNSENLTNLYSIAIYHRLRVQMFIV